jgi:hypothetical protein
MCPNLVVFEPLKSMFPVMRDMNIADITSAEKYRVTNRYDFDCDHYINLESYIIRSTSASALSQSSVPDADLHTSWLVAVFYKKNDIHSRF